MDLAAEPQTFTVEEAARILRIGRTTAYALAREWRATRGASGLPVLELGRSLRVPRAALAHLLAAPPADAPERDVTPPPSTRHSGGHGAQGTLWAGDPAGG
jgi:excisionase family DNA binding protein